MRDLFLINDREDSKKIKIFFLLSRMLILITIFFSYINFKDSVFKNIFLIFDSKHYLDIALSGYTKQYQYAFFPLLPLLIRCSLRIFNSYVPIIILNNILFFLTGIGIYNLSKKYYGKSKKIALLISLLWYLSPLNIYSTVLYTESVFCFLSVCILYLLKSNKKPLILGVLLGLLVCTRSVGSLLFFVIFIYLVIDLIKCEKYLYKNKIKRIIKIYIPATIISCIYPIYLHIKVNNWRYFIDVQYEYWSRIKSNIFLNYIREVQLFTSEKFLDLEPALQIEYISQSGITFMVLISMLILILFAFKNKKIKENLELLLYLVLTIWVCCLTCRNIGSPSTSNYRYFVACISYYLLFDNELFLKICILINLFINIYVIFSHSVGMFMY